MFLHDLCNYLWNLCHTLRAKESAGKRHAGLDLRDTERTPVGRESTGNERPGDRNGKGEAESILVEMVPKEP